MIAPLQLVPLEGCQRACRVCFVAKALTEFSPVNRGKATLRSACKACCVKKAQAFQRRNPLWGISYRLKRKYGLSLDAYSAMLERQGRRCAICRTEFDDSRKASIACVDHDHETGRVRGLLCFNCNTLLGKAGDQAGVLRAAIAYLETHHGE